MLSRESSRRLEVFCEKAMLWTDDDYLGPVHVLTDDGELLIEAAAPAWSERFTLPDGLRQGAGAVRRALEGVPRLRGATERREPADPTTIGHPRAGDALAAHRLVDLVYRSAADGGAPKSVN